MSKTTPATFFGGPDDGGQRMVLTPPPPSFRIPIPLASPPIITGDPTRVINIRCYHYTLTTRKNGTPRVDDAGRYRYDYAGEW